MPSPFDIYRNLLLAWNEKINLTAITDPNEIEIKHFEDSLTVAAHIPQNALLIDIGTGAGFPGIPLKIARPDIAVTLLEATRKRVDFLREVVTRLSLEGIATLNARAEDAGRDPVYRERYDAAVARAVANMAALAEYGLPFVKVGGLFIAMKGADIDDELAAARSLIAALGGAVEEVSPVTLSDGTRHGLVMIRKTDATPERYPRRAARVGRLP